MKKLIIGGIVIGVLVAAVVVIMNLGPIGLNFLDGKKGVVVRGKLVIPVTATGKVEAAEYIQIKSKASGKVQQIHVVEGQPVRKDDVLLELDPVDEDRNLEARKANLKRAKAALEKTKIVLDKQKIDLPLQTKIAEARLLDAEARLTIAQYDLERTQDLEKGGSTGPRELIAARANRDSAKAARDIAAADLTQARSNETVLIQSAQEDVAQAEAAHDEAVKAVEEAQLRQYETIVRAPSDAMVYSIQVKNGEVIQGGTQTFTGGTPLMMLANVESMFVIAQVDEADIGAIREIAPDYARPGNTKKLSEEEYRRRGRDILDHSNNGKKDAPAPSSSSRQSGESTGITRVSYQPSDHATNGEDVASDAPLPPEIDELMGRPVTVTVEAYRSEEFKGVIERILPEPVPAAVGAAIAFRVKIRLFPNDGGQDELQKLMGLQADLSFETKTQENVLLVKNEALASEGRDVFVWVPWRENENERWDKKKVAVKIGDTDGTNTVILSGLKEGEEVWEKVPVKTEAEKQKEND